MQTNYPKSAGLQSQQRFKKHLHNLIQITKALAARKQDHRCFHAAFIFKKHKIIGIGWNTRKTHPKNELFPYKPPIGQLGTHAEMHACMRAQKRDNDFSGCKIAVIRINNNGDLDYSRPCSGCLAFLKDRKFKSIWYSTEDGLEKCEGQQREI